MFRPVNMFRPSLLLTLAPSHFKVDIDSFPVVDIGDHSAGQRFAHIWNVDTPQDDMNMSRVGGLSDLR